MYVFTFCGPSDMLRGHLDFLCHIVSMGGWMHVCFYFLWAIRHAERTLRFSLSHSQYGRMDACTSMDECVLLVKKKKK